MICYTLSPHSHLNLKILRVVVCHVPDSSGLFSYTCKNLFSSVFMYGQHKGLPSALLGNMRAVYQMSLLLCFSPYTANHVYCEMLPYGYFVLNIISYK